MLHRRFREVEADHSLFTIVVRPPTNYHWIKGREKFHEKLRDNIRRKYDCEFCCRHYDEFDDRQRVHSHYIFSTDAPLDKDEFKAVIRTLLGKVWRRVERDMPPSLFEGHEEFFWDTPAWLMVEEDEEFDWSVYCDTPHNLPGLARYLPKDLKDRRQVRPVPDGWPLRTKGGRGFFGQPMKDYWRTTYQRWYAGDEEPVEIEVASPTVGPEAPEMPHERRARSGAVELVDRQAGELEQRQPGVPRRQADPISMPWFVTVPPAWSMIRLRAARGPPCQGQDAGVAGGCVGRKMPSLKHHSRTLYAGGLARSRRP